MLRTVFIALWSIQAALAQSSAGGQLTASGQSTKLTQVYAYSAEGVFDKGKDDSLVLLAGRPVAPAQLRDGFALRRMAEEGKLTFVQETIDAAGRIINFTAGNKAFKIAPSGGSSERVFAGKLDGKTIAGKVSTRGVQSAFGDTKYEYAAKFTASVLPKR